MAHWAADKTQVEKFNKLASAQGYTPDEALETLGVKAITDLRGGIGVALNQLQKVKKGTSAKSALAVLPPDEQRALYQNDELAQRGRMVRAFAPWANDDKYPVSDTEIALVVHRGEMLGVDVFNPREVQIWKDKRGNISFQLAHALMAQWANVTLGGHTRPKYTELTDEEKENRGVLLADHAVRCEFIMKADIPLIKTLIDAGWEPLEARLDVANVGFGTATSSEWGTTYFAANARDKMCKLEKRAYIDALRRRYGEPGEKDIRALRRARGEDSIAASDWAAAKDEPSTGETVMHAKMSARGVYDEPTESPEETLARNRAILHDDEGDDTIPGEIVEEKESPTKPEQKATKLTEKPKKNPPPAQNGGKTMKEVWARWDKVWNEAKSLGIEVESIAGDAARVEIYRRGKELAAQIKQAKQQSSWPPEIIAAVIEAELTENIYSADATLKHSKLTTTDPADVFVSWFKKYRESKDAGGLTPEAAGVANAWLADAK